MPPFLFRLTFPVLVDVNISLRDGNRDTLALKRFFNRLDDIEVNSPVIATLPPDLTWKTILLSATSLDENRGLWVLSYPRNHCG